MPVSNGTIRAGSVPGRRRCDPDDGALAAGPRRDVANGRARRRVEAPPPRSPPMRRVHRPGSL